MRSSGWVVAAALSAVGLVACGSGDPSVSSAEMNTLADLSTLEPGAFRDLPRRDYADPVIVEQCGDTDAKQQSATAVATSSALGYWPSGAREYMDQGGPDPAIARLGVAAYPTAESATAAVTAPDERGFGDCVFGAIERYDRSQGVDAAENEFRRANGASPRSDIETGSTTSDVDGATLRTLQARFSDEILGGTDNSHDIVETIGRSGRFVVTLYYVTNSQQGDASGARAAAERLAAEALNRARRASEPR